MINLHALKGHVPEEYLRRVLSYERLSGLLFDPDTQHDLDEVSEAATPKAVKQRLSASLGIPLKAADLHVHSSDSHDVLRTRENRTQDIYERGRDLGLDYIVITDHDNMDAYKELGERDGLVRGAEFTILMRYRNNRPNRKGDIHTIHSNVYCLDDEDFRMLEIFAKKGKMKSFVHYCRKKDLPYTFNHPFWVEMGEKDPNAALIMRVAKSFPALELNMHQAENQNIASILLAYRLDKGIVAVTDAHIGDIGRAFTVGPGRDFREFFRNVSRGENTYLVPRDLTKKYLTDETLKFIEGMFDSRVDISENAIVTETEYLNSVIILTTNRLKHIPGSGIFKWMAKTAVEYGVSIDWRIEKYQAMGRRMFERLKEYNK